jgi:hypothetical protein
VTLSYHQRRRVPIGASLREQRGLAPLTMLEHQLPKASIAVRLCESDSGRSTKEWGTYRMRGQSGPSGGLLHVESLRADGEAVADPTADLTRRALAGIASHRSPVALSVRPATRLDGRLPCGARADAGAHP